MIDKEKIEKGLRCCIEGDHCNSTDCPYYDAAPNIQGCTQALCQDVLALLKEQERKKTNRLPFSPDSNEQWT